MVILDLDNFGFFNDAHGHVVGDGVLRLVAGRIQAVCRPYDTVARFGGDEFATAAAWHRWRFGGTRWRHA